MDWRVYRKGSSIDFKIGTLEDIHTSEGLEFQQIIDMIKKDTTRFMVLMLYHGYITACKESYKKPRYSEVHAAYWYENLSQKARKEFGEKMVILTGEVSQMTGKKKEQKVK